MREELTGQPFGMFDFTPVGLGIAVAGVAFLVFGYRLLPGGRKAVATMDEAIDLEDYMTEARVLATSSVVGQTTSDLSKLCDDEVLVTGVIRHGPSAEPAARRRSRRGRHCAPRRRP